MRVWLTYGREREAAQEQESEGKRERLIISSMTDPHCMMHCTVGGEEEREGKKRLKATATATHIHTYPCDLSGGSGVKIAAAAATSLL